MASPCQYNYLATHPSSHDDGGKIIVLTASIVRSFLESRDVWVEVNISSFGVRIGRGMISSF